MGSAGLHLVLGLGPEKPGEVLEGHAGRVLSHALDGGRV